MTSNSLQRASEAALLTIFFLLANLRSLIFWEMFPDTTDPSSAAWSEVWMWMIAVLLMTGLLFWQRRIADYVLGWRRQPLVIALLALCLLSSLWSISWTATFSRSLALCSATLIAVYIAQSYSLSALLRILFWFSAITVVACYLMALLTPWLGRDFNTPFDGAWRGVFWHKNHLGVMAPFFCLIFLMQSAVRFPPAARAHSILSAVLYLFALGLVVFAKSAAGYILAVVLHGALGILLIWLKLRRQLRPIHYYAFLVLSAIAALLSVLNIDVVFRLLHRTPSLTGRVPLWTHLLQEWVGKRPWFGYGFGAFWMLEWIRIQLQKLFDWTYPIMIADNGFLDVLLYLGLTGLLLFLVIYVGACVRAVRHALAEPAALSFFPAFFMLYALVGNLSFSMLFATEYFMWGLIVVFLFQNSAPRGKPIDQG